MIDDELATKWWNELALHQQKFWLGQPESPEASEAWHTFTRAMGDPMHWAELKLEGLAESVEGTLPTATHSALVKALSEFSPLSGIRLALIHGGKGVMSLARRKVVNGRGEVLADDHEKWLQQQVRIDSGSASDAYQRLKDQDLYLTCCHLTNLVFAVDHGGPDQSDFLQIEVALEDEWIERRLFPSTVFYKPSDLQDLTDPWEVEPVSEDQVVQIRPMTYRLDRATNIQWFIALAAGADALDRVKFREKSFVKSSYGQSGEVVSSSEAFPDWDAAPIRATRLFDDWQNSSAGRSGARLCEHWVLQLNVYRSMNARTCDVGYVPAWTTKLKLAKVEPDTNIHRLFGKLQSLDNRVGVPFAWFFFMLHGNRVGESVAESVITAAESGQIVLAEHDYRVLKAWQTQPYGF